MICPFRTRACAVRRWRLARVVGLFFLAAGSLAAAPTPVPEPTFEPTGTPTPILTPEATPAPTLAPALSPVVPGTPPATSTEPPSPPAATPLPAVVSTPMPAPCPSPAPAKASGRRKAGREPAVTKAISAVTAPGTPIYSEKDCVAIAVRQNPDVLAAEKRVEASAATITTAKGPLFPALTAQGFYQRLDQSIANGGAVTTSVNSKGQTTVVAANFNRPDDYYGDVRITQNLYSGFAVRSRIAAAKLQTDAERFNYQAQLDTTALAVRVAFYTALYAEANIGVRQQAVDLLAAQVTDQQNRLAAGSVGQLNVNRTQVQLANERPSLLDAQAALSTAYANLAQLLGVSYPPGSVRAPFRLSGALEFRPMMLSLPDCLQRAQAARPEIRARLLTIDALRRLITVEKSTTRPQITAFAAYDIYSEPDIRTVDPYYSGYTLGVNASWTIFDGFATRGRVRNAQAQVGEAEAQLSATRKMVDNEVYTAYADLRAAESSLKPLSENTRLATETLDLTSRNFDAGVVSTSQLDVLQARVDLTRSRSGELAGRLAYSSALARLERAMALGSTVEGHATPLNPK